MNAPAQHTPGPWEWDNTLGSARLIQSGTGVPVLTAIPGVCDALPTVAVNTQEWDGPPYQLREATAGDANAALIAAAPKLLAALLPLELAVETWERGSRLSVEVSPAHLTSEVTLTVDDLRHIKAALAEAKGGAPC